MPRLVTRFLVPPYPGAEPGNKSRGKWVDFGPISSPFLQKAGIKSASKEPAESFVGPHGLDTVTKM